MSKTYREKISETGEYLLELIKRENNMGEISELTKGQIFDILSLQEKIADIYSDDIYIKNKKKRGGKLNIKKFSQKFTSKK